MVYQESGGFSEAFFVVIAVTVLGFILIRLTKINEKKGDEVKDQDIWGLIKSLSYGDIQLYPNTDDVCETAMNKITDQEILTKIALNAECWEVRRAATKRITDQNVLVKFLLNDKNQYVRLAAIERVIDQDILAKFALNHEEELEIRESAIRRITNQVMLMKILWDDESWAIRCAVIERINSQEIFTKFALDNYCNGNIRRASIKKITNKVILERIALNDTNCDIRREARSRVTKLEKLY